MPADGRLAGYGFTAGVTGDECGASVGGGGAEIVAGTDEDVCVFSLSITLDQPDTTGISSSDPAEQGGVVSAADRVSGSVTEGSNTVVISPNQLADAGHGVDYAVGVPSGQPAVLALSAEGFSQSFSLTAGRTVGTAPQALYRSRGAYELALWPEVTEPLDESYIAANSAPGRAAAMEVTLTEVELDYFFPGDPSVQAPGADEAYLGIVFSTAQETTPSDVDLAGFEPAALSDVTLHLPDGRVIPAEAVVQDNMDLLAGTWVFAVPADLTNAEIVVSPAPQQAGVDVFSRTNDYGPAEVSFGHASWRIELPGGVSGSAGQPAAESGTSTEGPSPSQTTTSSTTILLKSRSPGTGGGGLSVPAKVAAGGGGFVVVVCLIVLPIRRRRHTRKGLATTVAFPSPQVPQPLGAPTNEQPPPDMRAAAPPAEEPSAEQSEPSTAAATASPPRLSVKVLGPVQVDGFVRPPARPTTTELAVYLALAAPATVSSATLRAAFGKDGRDLKPATVHNYMSALRVALGSERLVTNGHEGFRLEGELDCDWATFQALRERRVGDRVATLEEALSLVRGAPFEGIRSSRYRWADDYMESTAAGIEAVAHELVELHRAAGRREEAAAAATKGLVAVPSSLVLHEDRLRATAGDLPRFQRAWRHSVAALPDERYLKEVYAELARRPGG